MSRFDVATTGSWESLSLVGSFFHADVTRQWQGCVVAEPAPGVYLVELFDWIAGSSTHQRLVPIEEMTGWSFYDSDDWMIKSIDVVQRKWEAES